MSNYDDSNRGAIWKNDKKETDRHPDFKGTMNVDGKDYWVSAWKRKADAHPNAPALSFSVQEKEAQHKQGMKQATKSLDNAFDDDPDQVPF